MGEIRVNLTNAVTIGIIAIAATFIWKQGATMLANRG